MKKGDQNSHLDQEKLKNSPFGVPESYFESFPGRIMERIRAEEERMPEQKALKVEPPRSGLPYLEQLRREESPYFARPGLIRRRILLAAAAFLLGMVTIPLIRMLGPEAVAPSPEPDMAMLEQLQVFEDDRYLYDLMRTGAEPVDSEDAYEEQVIEYLAIGDVEEVLLFD